jgi:hypothetical protein
MESFQGIFIASTNLMDNLDPASLRRFDIKVRFDYLASNQAWVLLQRYCEALELPPPDAEVRSRLAYLAQLTPGDFALLARQHGFRPLQSAAAFLSELERECSIKVHSKRPIGFV